MNTLKYTSIFIHHSSEQQCIDMDGSPKMNCCANKLNIWCKKKNAADASLHKLSSFSTYYSDTSDTLLRIYQRIKKYFVKSSLLNDALICVNSIRVGLIKT